MCAGLRTEGVVEGVVESRYPGNTACFASKGEETRPSRATYVDRPFFDLFKIPAGTPHTQPLSDGEAICQKTHSEALR